MTKSGNEDTFLSRLLKNAHHRIIFRDDFRLVLSEETKIELELPASLRGAAPRIEAGDPLLIEGPDDEEKKRLAEAVVETRKEPIEFIDCRDEDATRDALQNNKTAGVSKALYLNRIDRASLALQDRILVMLDANDPKVPTLIFSAPKDLSIQVKSGEFRGELLQKIEYAKILIPPLQRRRWDIVPFVVYLLRETDMSIKYITYNSLDFLTCYDWPGDVTLLRQVVRNLRSKARRATGQPHTINFDHIRECIPPEDEDSIVARWKAKYRDHYDQTKRELKEKNQQISEETDIFKRSMLTSTFDWYINHLKDWVSIYGRVVTNDEIPGEADDDTYGQRIFGSYYVYQFLKQEAYSCVTQSHETRLYIAKYKARAIADQWLKPRPNLAKHNRLLKFVETGAKRPPQPSGTRTWTEMEISWLRDEDREIINDLAEQEIPFNDAEGILFDVEKMHKAFKEVGVFPERPAKKPTICKSKPSIITETESYFYPDFLKKISGGAARFKRERAVKIYLNYYRTDHPKDPYAEKIKKKDRDIVKKVVKAMQGVLEPTTIERNTLKLDNIRQMGQWQKLLDQK